MLGHSELTYYSPSTKIAGADHTPASRNAVLSLGLGHRSVPKIPSLGEGRKVSLLSLPPLVSLCYPPSLNSLQLPHQRAPGVTHRSLDPSLVSLTVCLSCSYCVILPPQNTPEQFTRHCLRVKWTLCHCTLLKKKKKLKSMMTGSCWKMQHRGEPRQKERLQVCATQVKLTLYQ